MFNSFQVKSLTPILTSTGRSSDIMVPMAIPSFGGMIIALLTVFVIPVLYCWVEELKVRWLYNVMLKMVFLEYETTPCGITKGILAI